MNKLCKKIEETLDDLGNDHNMKRRRPYTGQPHTDTGIRGATEIKGITFRDLRDAYIRSYCLSMGVDNPIHYKEAGKGENATICENDIYDLKDTIDPLAVSQNLSCEIEKLMGIFPNITKAKNNSK